MKITSFSLNNFAPEEFFGGAKSVSMNGPKFSKSDRTMKAFSFVERNKGYYTWMGVAQASHPMVIIVDFHQAGPFSSRASTIFIKSQHVSSC